MSDDTKDNGNGGENKKSDIDEIRKQVESRRADEEKLYVKDDSGKDKITSKHIIVCLNANELGDGILFCDLHRDWFMYNKIAKEWMIWAGHHWERDIMEASLAACDDVANLYLNEYSNICHKIREAQDDGNDANINVTKLQSRQKSLLKRASRLRSSRGRQNCLHFAHSNKQALAIMGNEIDRQPWLLACPNCVIDLQTGKERDGRRNDYLLKAAAADWKGIDAPRELWEEKVLEILSGDEEMMEFLQRLFGCAIVGERTEDILGVLTGRGRNGKGLIVGTISHVLGDLAGPIPSEMLLDQGRFKSSSGPTPDIMSLKGLRIAFAAETDEHRKFSPAQVKWLTGGDELIGRNPHDKYPTRFSPTHTLFLQTNHKPHAPDTDFAFWQRMVMIPFDLSFVDPEDQEDAQLMHFLPEEVIRPKDRTLEERLKLEASGILAWLVEGCLKWQQQGLNTPVKVKEAMREYQRDESLLGNFIDEHCQLGDEYKDGATKLYDAFAQWYDDNISGKKVPKQKSFGAMMKQRFRSEKFNGIYWYFGLKLDPAFEWKDEKLRYKHGGEDDSGFPDDPVF